MMAKEKYFVYYIGSEEVEAHPAANTGDHLAPFAVMKKIAEDRQIPAEAIRVACEWRAKRYLAWLMGKHARRSIMVDTIEAIRKLYNREYYETRSDSAFADLRKVPLAYSTTGEGEYEIQVYADLLLPRMFSEVDGNVVEELNYECLAALCHDIEFFDFDTAIADAEDAWRKKEGME